MADIEGVAHAAATLEVNTRSPAPPTLTRPVALWSARAGLLTTLAAAYVPAHGIARIDPAEALCATRATAMTGQLPVLRFACVGAALSLAACVPAWVSGEVNGYLSSTALLIGATFFVPLAVNLLRLALLRPLTHWFGIPARLALDSVERSLARSAITVEALMSAVSMSMSTGGYVSSFERSIVQWADDAFPADAVMTAGSPLVNGHHVAFAESELEKLHAVPGLRRATSTSTITAVRAPRGATRAGLGDHRASAPAGTRQQSHAADLTRRAHLRG